MQLTNQSFEHMSAEDKFNFVQQSYQRVRTLLSEVDDIIRDTNRCCDSLTKDYGETLLVRNSVFVLGHKEMPIRIPNATKLYQFQSELKTIPLNITH